MALSSTVFVLTGDVIKHKSSFFVDGSLKLIPKLFGNSEDPAKDNG